MTPPSISRFSSTPAEIGLKDKKFHGKSVETERDREIKEKGKRGGQGGNSPPSRNRVKRE